MPRSRTSYPGHKNWDNRAHVAQARDLSSMHAPMFGLRGCLNISGQGSFTLTSTGKATYKFKPANFFFFTTWSTILTEIVADRICKKKTLQKKEQISFFFCICTKLFQCVCKPCKVWYHFASTSSGWWLQKTDLHRGVPVQQRVAVQQSL